MKLKKRTIEDICVNLSGNTNRFYATEWKNRLYINTRYGNDSGSIGYFLMDSYMATAFVSECKKICRGTFYAATNAFTDAAGFVVEPDGAVEFKEEEKI